MKGFIKFLVIIIVVVVVILLCKNYVKNDDEITQVNSDNVVENEVVEETEISNEVEDKTVQNEVPEVINKEDNVYESDTDVGTTNKKQEAIDKVKEVWGEDNTVTFRCDSVTKDGEYIIAVVSTQTMSVKNYFRVNLEKNTVDVDY